jgi:hypothetical protein
MASRGNAAGGVGSQSQLTTKTIRTGGWAFDSGLILGLVLLTALLARLYEGAAYFLDPDEAMHFLEASQASIALAYQAALTNAHPPLLILLLYFWRDLGHSELILRLPSVLAGTACCWLTYLWLKLATGRKAAFLGLLLMAFSPALIRLSAEIRQYALLLFFIAACLYLGERALRENSAWLMVLFSLSLYGALLVHYAGLLFAIVIGIYMLVRLYPYQQRFPAAAWAAGQIGGIAIGGYFVLTHVWRLRQESMLGAQYDAFARKFVFHPGQQNVFGFAAGRTVQVFTYFFSHGLIGSLGLLAFLYGLLLFLRKKNNATQSSSGSRELALLIFLAFAVNCIPALLGKYPYGATRHSAFLFPFVAAGISFGLSSLPNRKFWRTAAAVLVALAVCNFFPAPPPAIHAKDQSRAVMREAVNSFRQSAQPGSMVIADYQSALLFGYYVCGHGVVQTFFPMQPLFRAECGSYTVITPSSNVFRFNGQDIESQLKNISAEYKLARGTDVWLFSAGWISDSSPELEKKLAKFGCATPRKYGKDIFWCPVAIGDVQQSAKPVGDS